MSKKLGMIIVIAMIGVLVGSRVAKAAYPTGQAYVTLITPFNGIAKYFGVGGEYVNQVATAQWGTILESGMLSSRATVAGINATSGNLVVKSGTSILLSKVASASIARVAMQAALLVGTMYFGELVEDWANDMVDKWDYNQGRNVFIKYMPDPDIPEGADYWWDGTTGMGVGATSCGPKTDAPQLPSAHRVQGFFTSYAAAEAACAAAKGGACGAGSFSALNYCDPDWCCGWSTRYYREWGTPTDQYTDHYYVYTNTTSYWDHIISTEGLLTPVDVTWDEVEDRVASESETGGRAWEDSLRQGSMAAIAPMVNEEMKNFPESNGTTMGEITPELMQKLVEALKGGISEDDKKGIEDDDPDGPEPTEGDWEYTPEQMAAAQNKYDKQLEAERKSEYEAIVMPEVPAETEPENPEKLSLADAMQAKLDAMEELTVWEQLQNLKDQDFSGGTCSFEVDMGNYGLITFSLCEWEEALELLGSMMFGAMSLFWLLWLFHGRGDF